MKEKDKKKLAFGLLILFLGLGFLLRFIFLTKIPQGLNWDEASIGYNAYSLLKTGKDEFGQPWPVLIESFGDFKTGFYSFLLVPVIKNLGLTTYAIRLPNVFVGLLLILASFYLALKVLKKPLLASFVAGLITISPWAIHVSRFVLEWLFGLPIMITGFSLLLDDQKSKIKILLAGFLLGFSLYSYHSLRFFLPFLILSYVIIFRKKVGQFKKTYFFALLVFILTLLPLVSYFKKENLFARPTAVAVFTNEEKQSELMEGIYRQQLTKLPFLRLFNNKVVFYGWEILNRYLAHFSPQFLFFGKDVTPRIEIYKVGKLYFISLPFLIIGLYQAIKSKNKKEKFLISWLLFAPLAASLTIDSPHGIRSLLFLPVLQIFIIKGIGSVWLNLKKHKKLIRFTFFSTVLFFYLINFSFFLWRYFLFYPEDTARHWQDGYQTLVKKINQYQSQYDQVIVSTHYGQPHIFLAFFTPIEPATYQKLVKNQKAFFNTRVGALGKIEFRQIQSQDFCLQNSLIVTSQTSFKEEIPRLEKIAIKNRFHQPEVVFEIFDTNENKVLKQLCSTK